MHGRLATVTDRRQALRLRRLAFSLLMGGAAHTLVCWLILQWGFFRGGATVFYALFGTIWAGHLGLLLFARTGLNRRPWPDKEDGRRAPAPRPGFRRARPR